MSSRPTYNQDSLVVYSLVDGSGHLRRLGSGYKTLAIEICVLMAVGSVILLLFIGTLNKSVAGKLRDAANTTDLSPPLPHHL